MSPGTMSCTNALALPLVETIGLGLRAEPEPVFLVPGYYTPACRKPRHLQSSQQR